MNMQSIAAMQLPALNWGSASSLLLLHTICLYPECCLLPECAPSEFCIVWLQDIMKGIYKACKDASKEYDTTLQAGANIAGFLKVAEAMTAQGM